MGTFKEDRYVAEFIINKPVDEVWQALEVTRDGEPAWLQTFPCMPGFESTGEIIDSQPAVQVRVHKTSEPCKGSEIAISVESVETGTRVIVVQSGFPAWVKDALEVFTIGGDQIVADLTLYLERGVLQCRHGMPWAFAGFTAREVGTGLEVTNVMPDFYGARVGLAEGDLLLTLGGAPLFTQHCLQTAMRLLKAGDSVEASWVRGSSVEQESAML